RQWSRETTGSGARRRRHGSTGGRRNGWRNGATARDRDEPAGVSHAAPVRVRAVSQPVRQQCDGVEGPAACERQESVGAHAAGGRTRDRTAPGSLGAGRAGWVGRPGAGARSPVGGRRRRAAAAEKGVTVRDATPGQGERSRTPTPTAEWKSNAES